MSRSHHIFTLFNAVTVFFFVVCTPLASAGQQSKYEGAFLLKSDSIAGKAAYEYILSSSDTVMNGKFSYNKTLHDNGDSDHIIGIDYTGQYSGNKKSGKWEFSKKNFVRGNIASIEGNKVYYDAEGEKHTVEIHFNSGVAHGKWQAMRGYVRDSEFKDTSFIARSRFKGGMLTGAFTGGTRHLKFSGEFTDAGLAAGTWHFKHYVGSGRVVNEYRVYEDGVFKEHYFAIDNKTFYIKHIGLDTTPGKDDEIWDTLAISNEYFRIINNTDMGIDEERSARNGIGSDSIGTFSRSSSVFLEEALSAFSKYEGKRDIWLELPGSDSIRPKMFCLRKFPFSESEEERLKDARLKLDTTLKIIKGFFKDSQIDVSRHSYENLSFKYEVMKVYRERIADFEGVVNSFSDPAFKYINRSEIFPYICPDVIYPEEVSYEYRDEEKTKRFSFPEEIDNEKSNLERVHEHLSDIYESVSEIVHETDIVLEKYRQEAQLKEKQELLVRKRDSILTLYRPRSESEKFNQFHRETSPGISEFTEKSFKEYAAEEIKEKIELIDGLIDCYDEILTLYKVQSDIPKKLDRLDDLYTRTVWNPYTFTDMDETVKEKLYSAFRDKLVPLLIENMGNDIKCGEIEQSGRDFNLAYNKMVELRDRDTKELEREIRRASDIETFFEMLKIDRQP